MRFLDDFALMILILFLWIPFYWLVFHSALRLWRQVGNRSFWLALAVWGIFAAALVLERHALFARRVGGGALSWVAGGLLFLIAVWLEAQTRRTFGWIRLSGLTELHPEHRLSGVVSTGIYARLRHPRYLLYMLMVLSMGFLTGAVPIFLLAFLNVLMYQILAPLEERKLLDQYGPRYENYRKLVPRFVPHLGRTPEAGTSS